MEVHGHSDHKNLTFQNFSNDCVNRWRLIAEEFNITWHYIKGESNVVADALSCLPLISPEPSSPSSECLAFEEFFLAVHLSQAGFPLHFLALKLAQDEAPEEMEAYTDTSCFGNDQIELKVDKNELS